MIVENIERKEWVTVKQAAKLLTAAGDPIDPSNVSRYLKRFPEIPQEKQGKCRYVDAAALMRHRNHNVQVVEKRGSRGAADCAVPASPVPVPDPPRVVMPIPESTEDSVAPAGNELQEANLTLKRIQIRAQQLDLEEREGKLVPSDDVLAISSGALAAFVRALEHGETEITQEYGRDIGAAFRKVRKRAQARAARSLIDAARKFLPAEQVSALSNTDLG